MHLLGSLTSSSAQQAGVLWSSFVVLVGGSAHGGAHACREMGQEFGSIVVKHKYGGEWKVRKNLANEFR